MGFWGVLRFLWSRVVGSRALGLRAVGFRLKVTTQKSVESSTLSCHCDPNQGTSITIPGITTTHDPRPWYKRLGRTGADGCRRVVELRSSTMCNETRCTSGSEPGNIKYAFTIANKQRDREM